MTDSTSTAPGGGIEVRSLFPTPLVIATPPVTEDENARLRKTILDRETAAPSASHSNLLGWQSADDFADWGGAEGEKVLAAARAIADRLTGDRAGNRVAVDWFVNAWANVNRKGQSNDMHAHPGCAWSGCYYVDDGREGETAAPQEGIGGALQIADPRGIAVAMYAPELAPALSGCQTMGGMELIPARTGNLLVFPAWLAHGVRPYLGEGARISIAFNFALPAAQTGGTSS